MIEYLIALLMFGSACGIAYLFLTAAEQYFDEWEE